AVGLLASLFWPELMVEVPTVSSYAPRPLPPGDYLAVLTGLVCVPWAVPKTLYIDVLAGRRLRLLVIGQNLATVAVAALVAGLHQVRLTLRLQEPISTGLLPTLNGVTVVLFAIVGVWLFGRAAGMLLAIVVYIGVAMAQGAAGPISQYGPFTLGLTPDHMDIDATVHWWWLVPLLGLVVLAGWCKNIPPGINPLSGSRLVATALSVIRTFTPSAARTRSQSARQPSSQDSRRRQ
ncbi:MAG: hypothetical protein LBH68_06865, partial [Bifidobacteriaceae bacterium]|nr:hypothetical protein [Bifidobacteriaceae bacterium]